MSLMLINIKINCRIVVMNINSNITRCNIVAITC